MAADAAAQEAAAQAAEEAADEDEEVGESSASAARRKKKTSKDEDDDEEMPDVEEEEEAPVKTRRRRASRATTEVNLKVVGKRKRKSTTIEDTESEFEEIEEEDVEEEVVTVRATRTRKPTKAQLAKQKAEEKRNMDEDDEFNPDNFIDPAYRPAPGQIAFCADCECRFTVTPYSRSADDGEGLLCHPCGKKSAPVEKAARKKKQATRTNKKTTHVLSLMVTLAESSPSRKYASTLSRSTSTMLRLLGTLVPTIST